jgi:hypothetical protein
MTSRDLIAVKDGSCARRGRYALYSRKLDSALMVYKYTPEAKLCACAVIYLPLESHSFFVRTVSRDGLAPSIDELGSIMPDEELKAELERLRNENAGLKKGSSSGIRLKVSEKGAVSVYGMGRFPVTLYKEQWLKLLDMSDDIRAFIAANEAQLKAKD